MSPAEVLLTELRTVGIEAYLDPVGELRCRSRRGVLTPELRRRVAELKVDLIFLLEDEAYEIAWRAEAMRALAGDDGLPPAVIAPVSPTGDIYACCGEPSAYGRQARCPLCALAAAQVIEEWRSGRGVARHPRGAAA